MESKKLEALLMAADLGSFTKAAEVLGYTQSGLTHMMNSLEKDIGFTLLDRGRSGVRLTDEGRRVEGAIRDFLQANARLEGAIASVGANRGESLRLCAYASMAMHWLPTILEHFHNEYPNVAVDIRMVDVDSSYQLLREGKMDAIFASRQEDVSCEWLHLADDPMYAVLPKDYPVGEQAYFPIAEFSGQNFLIPTMGYEHDIMRVMDRYAVKPHVLATRVDDPSTINLVEHGIGITMMSKLTLEGRTDGVKILPVEPFASRDLGIALNPGALERPVLRDFVVCTKRVLPLLSNR